MPKKLFEVKMRAECERVREIYAINEEEAIKEIAELEITNLEAVETYVVVTVPDDPKQMSANLQGPILINCDNGYAKQLVLVNSDYRVKHMIMDEISSPVCSSIDEPELVEI